MRNILYLKDFYKVGHYEQYPDNTTLIFSNFTPRGALKDSKIDFEGSIFFGLEYFLKQHLVDLCYKFHEEDLPCGHDSDYYYEDFKNAYLHYRLDMNKYLRSNKSYQHIEKLLDYIYFNGKLPVSIYALPEGTLVPFGVPALVIFNTEPEFYWLPNMLETLLSATLWGPCTSATIAYEYRKLLDKYAEATSDIPEFVDWQAHDFSFRGMYGAEAAIMSGLAHLQYFKGTDTIPALIASGKEGGSVAATEHSVMSAGLRDNELETYDRLITKVYPEGIISIVSDTWDLWNVVDNILPALKDKIMSRNGKVVIRPDSGDPVEIICGKNYRRFKCIHDAENWAYETTFNFAHRFRNDKSRNEFLVEESGCLTDGFEYSTKAIVSGILYELIFEVKRDLDDYRIYPHDFKSSTPIKCTTEDKGLIECLWDLFGGTVNSKGYKQLDPHIGAIYGDSITFERATKICERLKEKGFASTNIVFGIGSYTYQYNTRDTLGWAMKATYAEINGKGVAINKNPKTDSGIKKSHSGLLKVIKNSEGKLGVKQNITWDEFYQEDNELKLVYPLGIGEYK